jgi:anti-sigma regulatory factor (Ser/Thr protein kinase)
MWRILAEFLVASQPDDERLAVEQVAAAVQVLNLAMTHVERLKTAVSRALDGIFEHERRYGLEIPVFVRVLAWQKVATLHGLEHEGELKSRTRELGSGPGGQPSPRGLGFFLIEKTYEELSSTNHQPCHAVELYLYLEGE